MTHRRLLVSLFALLALLALVMPGLAQSENRITLPDGYSILLPQGWEADPDAWDAPGTFLSLNESYLLVYTPDELASLAGDEITSARSALIETIDQLYDVQLTQGDIERVVVNGLPAAEWRYLLEGDDTVSGIFYVIQVNNETFIAIDVWGPTEEETANVKVAHSVARSFGTAGAAASGDSCFVSVTTERSAALRVGPGENRSSVAFLPAGTEFVVLGQAEDSAGNTWFKLDKAEAAPRSAASEVWVAAANVNTTGACSAVADAAAPPINPIIAAPPASSSGAGDQSGAAAAPGTMPAAGTWVLTFNRTLNASCAGTSNFSLDLVNDLGWSQSDINYTSSLSLSGSGFNFGGSFYRPQGGANFVGSETFPDGTNAQAYATVIDSGRMSGSMVGNFTIDGTACSITFTFNMVRR